MKIQAFHTAFGEDNQVFSTDEILNETTLAKITEKEGEDDRLKFLYFLRNFKKTNKAWFDKIKKLPLKSRTGRSAIAINKPELQNGTAAFLKTDKKLEFYWVDSNNKAKEITPIEAFRLFKADENEKNVKLITQHHDHVNKAIEHFESLEYQSVQSHTDPGALGGVAQRARKWLSELVIKYSGLTQKQTDNIQKMVILIDLGKYANLASEVDKLQKRKLNLDNAILEIDKIAKKYNVDSSDTHKGNKRKIEKPVLIISESFE
jgi:hypothetical protein